MALVVGENTYASLEDIQAWLDDRGYDSLTATDADVLRAMDYMESLPWTSEPVGDDLHWGDAPPQAVVNALCQAVKMEIESPGMLMAETQQRVRSEEVVGAVKVEYEPGGNVQTFPAIQRYLRGYISSGNIIRVELT